MNPSSAPTLPTKLFYDKRPPFHDTVNLETNFDVIGLGAWYSHEDYELISMVQLQPTGSSNGRLRQVHVSPGTFEQAPYDKPTATSQQRPVNGDQSTTNENQSTTNQPRPSSFSSNSTQSSYKPSHRPLRDPAEPFSSEFVCTLCDFAHLLQDLEQGVRSSEQRSPQQQTKPS